MGFSSAQRAINRLQAEQTPEMKPSGQPHYRRFLKKLVFDLDVRKIPLQQGNQLSLPRFVKMIDISGTRAASATVRHGEDRHAILPQAPVDVAQPCLIVAQVLEHFEANDSRESARSEWKLTSVPLQDRAPAAQPFIGHPAGIPIELHAHITAAPIGEQYTQVAAARADLKDAIQWPEILQHEFIPLIVQCDLKAVGRRPRVEPFAGLVH
jgi:hypothetical protein